MNAKDTVLTRIAAALDRPESDQVTSLPNQPPEVTKRLLGGRSHTLPKVSDDLLGALIAAMESVLMTVERLPSLASCPAAVAYYLKEHAIDTSAEGSVRVSPALTDIGWPAHYAFGAATGNEKVGITPCAAAVAETGSIVTLSGQATPATLNFLPETHVIILHESQVVRHVDDVFSIVRSEDRLPRSVNFITGPSRTADIEQTLEIGVHGPRRMHVLLLAD